MAGRNSRARFILNPLAVYRGPHIETVIRRTLAGTGTVYDIRRTAYPGHGAELAREAAEEGFDLVVAVGGDGTVNEVGRALIGGEVALGVIPAGSGNALARALGIPLDVRQACRTLLQGEARRLDAGKIGDAVFFSTAGIGLDVEVCLRFNTNRQGRRGFLRYGLLTFCAFRAYLPEDMDLFPEAGDPVHARLSLLTVANTPEYGNGAVIAPGASPSDGMLDVCLVENLTLTRALRHVPKLFAGTIDRMPGYRMFRTRHIRVERASPGCFQIDGEVRNGPASLEVTVVPGAIRIVLPAGHAP